MKCADQSVCDAEALPGSNFCVRHLGNPGGQRDPRPPAIKLDADGVSVEFSVGAGRATVQLNEAGAKALLARLGDFSKNPEVRMRFVAGVLDLFLEATNHEKSQ